ncbi:putative thiol peroxidase [Andreprevotia sp. IGB-42]|uniref:thiol peroxidase n=1 Tax=Andreprevotia sp. IGB-42 TaxID=2497473 RepID=UPI00135AE7F1|nr:thiol peroxidase [Andreprevotia sp. IGB-42]KAF0812831.1 putative thiol peroxidase [Andreprevotia sp. IGB-42]
MATIMLNGTPVSVGGHFPRVGEDAHSFMLVDQNMQDVALSKFYGRRKLIAVIPSIDAAVGLTIARRLEAMADLFDNTVVLVVSVDTPYALARTVQIEGFRKIQLLCTLRGRDFHKDYGVMITDVPLSGLMATALIVLDTFDTVQYAELVHELNSEPNFEAAAQTLLPPPAPKEPEE